MPTVFFVAWIHVLCLADLSYHLIMTEGKQIITGAVTSTAIAIASLLYSIYGKPPFGYFGFMKLVVTASCLFVTYALYRRSKATAPIGVVLAGLAFVEMTGSMRRQQWLPWNWATVLVLGVAALILVWPLSNSVARAIPALYPPEQEQPSPANEPERPRPIYKSDSPVTQDEEWQCRCGQWNPGALQTCSKCKRSILARY